MKHLNKFKRPLEEKYFEDHTGQRLQKKQTERIEKLFLQSEDEQINYGYQDKIRFI